AFTVLTYTLPGMPLIYSGQEAGLDKRLKFFDKDEIHWKKHPAADLYKTLNFLKRDNPALWNGEFGGTYQRVVNSLENTVMTFFRKKGRNKVMVMVNLTPKPVEFKLKLFLPNGEFTDINTGEKISFHDTDQYHLKPWGYRIFETGD
ncbi:MAG: alpha-glucosidase C-terminal domain-containing protein, partial [Fidelibacterota bacterium]